MNATDLQSITDATYKAWHETYVQCTTEKLRVHEALNRAISAIEDRGTFLDIGAGDGDLTFRVAPQFATTTVVEPNRLVRDVFERQGAEFVLGYFEEVDLGARQFDFILCSHVFWLVGRDRQKAFIEKMYRHLAPGGSMAIIMVSPLGQSHEFYQRFFFDYNTTTHEILKDLHVLGLTAQVVPVSFEFGCRSFDDFFNICKLFTLESWLHPATAGSDRVRTEIGDVNAYTQRKLEEISQFVRTQCRRGDGYAMNEEVDVVVVAKPKEEQSLRDTAN